MRRTLMAVVLAGLALAGCSENTTPADDDDDEPTQEASVTRAVTRDTTREATREPSPTATDASPTSRPSPATSDVGGSRANPAPIGMAVEVEGWSIVVNSTVPDGTARIAEENPFNDPPEAGRQFYLIHVSATYVSDEYESSSFWADLETGALGPSNVAYDSFDDSCGFISSELNTLAEVFTGGTIEGDLCWSVTAEDAADLLLFIQPSFEDDDRRWFALE